MNTFNYKQLIVWKKAIELLQLVYMLCEKLPKAEEYNLKSQLRRAALSVSSNIAEGASRFSGAEQKRFYEIARGSIIEIDSQLEVCLVLGYLTDTDCASIGGLILEEYKMLSVMINKAKEAARSKS